MKAVGLLQEHRTDVVDKWMRLEKGENLLHRYHAKQMYQLIDLESFDGKVMNKVLDHISISEDGHICVIFLEGTEVEL
ncbi:site-specific recombinase resolvase [Lactococcus ileimucosae]|uniref:site-specific recombinase resolvase n=1 Tax=Lactococcus ileimucosae TaxID=2941329 RepID=UPI003F794197